MLEPALGPDSVLNLDDAPHMRARKLLLPPFHGERIERYGELMVEATRREMESWPVGEPFALRPHTQRITLAVILRAVFGITDEARLDRATALIERFTRRVSPITNSRCCGATSAPAAPGGASSAARAALDASSTRRSRCGGPRRGREERDDVLSLLLAARHEDGTPMSDDELRDELVTVRRRRPRDDRDGARLGARAAAAEPGGAGRLRESLAAGESDYLEATVRETLRSRPVPDRRRPQADRAGDGRRLRARRRRLHDAGDRRHPPPRGPLPAALRVPARALPREGKADNYAWMPFGGGVRRCIGAAFAEYEMRTILREIVERAELRAAEPAPERAGSATSPWRPARGTRVVLERPLAYAGAAASASSALA